MAHYFIPNALAEVEKSKVYRENRVYIRSWLCETPLFTIYTL